MIRKSIYITILMLVFKLGICNSFWKDIEFIQKSYTNTTQLKCNVSMKYFDNYQSGKVSYSLDAVLMIMDDKYYSKLGTREMIINGDKGILIDNSKRYVYTSSAEEITADPEANPISWKDITAMMDSSRGRIDTAYVLSEKDGIRTYYLSLKNSSFYKFIHFSFNTTTGIISKVDYFFKYSELAKLGKLTVHYSNTAILTKEDMAVLNLSTYFEKGKAVKLAARYNTYELVTGIE